MIPTELYLVLEIDEKDGANFSAVLEAALGAAPFASVLVTPPLGRPLAIPMVNSIVELLQSRNIAALIADDASLARQLRTDGVHLTWSKDQLERFAEAREILGARFIIGVDAGRSRDDAMTLGEAGADYIAFGPGEAQPDLIAWWAEIFEVPCVAFDVADRAWHAGRGSWEGEGDVNARSIGIEIVNGGHDFGLPDFKDAQIEAVIALIKEIFVRWPALNASRVVGHSDIAPERKADPGEKFPWKRLADADVAIWPEHVAAQARSDDVVSRAQVQLAAFGYDVKQSGILDNATRAAIVAFQRRFRPSNLDGALDEETLNLIGAVLRLKPVVL